MPLSKARNAKRMRIARATKNGVLPRATQLLEILSLNQRKERLADLIATPISPEKINASHIIAAIDVYNKMDKVYSDAPQIVGNRTINIIVSSKQAKQLTEGIGGFDIFTRGNGQGSEVDEEDWQGGGW